jgi:hypothetical protein
MSTVPEDFPINPEIVANGEIEGIPWVSARAPIYGAVNGYIRLPDGHPWLEMNYIENDVPWGEITYTRGNWIGFDSLHSGQVWPEQIESSNYYRTYASQDQIMTDEMVIAWTQQLAHEAKNYVSSGTYSI